MTNFDELKKKIISIREEIQAQKPLTEDMRTTIDRTIAHLDRGDLRVAEKINGEWVTHAWIKEAILLYFKSAKMEKFQLGPFEFFDKIPLKRDYDTANVRVVPPAVARFGSFLEPGVILMPSYVNIGAYVGKGTMVDTWATVGSCAQIGAGVHLSGGVGIGGVLEPASALPVIVEDNAFIGSRSIIVEGVRISEEAVIAANVSLTASTPIIDTRHKKFSETRGFIPARAVVVPGTKERKIDGGIIHTNCAYIIGERKASTDRKTSLTNALREFSLSV